MKNKLLLLMLGLSLSAPGFAQQSAQDAEKRAFEACGDISETGAMPGGQTATISIAGGSCVNGKRNGTGVIARRMEAVRAIGTTATVLTQEGRFVNGQMVGLWCTTRLDQFINGKLNAPTGGRDHTGCHVFGGAGGAIGGGIYRKLPDGRWQLYSQGLPADPPTTLAAGSLEAESARLLAAATGGNMDTKAELAVQSQVLDDLVRGSRIVLAPAPGRISLRDKRVAVVLSSNMIAELERFRRERQALINATAGLAGEAASIRATFIKASNPDRLLTNVAKVLRRHARDVQPYDDSLAALGPAGFDYALVVDWKYTTRMDLQGRYDAFPSGSYDLMLAGRIPPLAGGSMSGFLISPDLKAVAHYPGTPVNHPKHSSGTGAYDAGDSGYLFGLGFYFENYLGKSPDDDGDAINPLKDWLR